MSFTETLLSKTGNCPICLMPFERLKTHNNACLKKYIQLSLNTANLNTQNKTTSGDKNRLKAPKENNLKRTLKTPTQCPTCFKNYLVIKKHKCTKNSLSIASKSHKIKTAISLKRSAHLENTREKMTKT